MKSRIVHGDSPSVHVVDEEGAVQELANTLTETLTLSSISAAREYGESRESETSQVDEYGAPCRRKSILTLSPPFVDESPVYTLV
eukprot:PDM70523.1 hypothetical protein PRIPAC_46769 [Pristionchus pacificus]